MKENHKNLTSNVAFEELPLWFQEAKTKDAVVIYADGYFIWVNGYWYNGIWLGDVWKKGTWVNGV